MRSCKCGNDQPLLIAKSSDPPTFYFACYLCGEHTSAYQTAKEAEREWNKLNGGIEIEEAKEKPKTGTKPENIRRRRR